MAATFEKANTYVFAAPIIRDREVEGSNPLAPTGVRPFGSWIDEDEFIGLSRLHRLDVQSNRHFVADENAACFQRGIPG